MNYLQNEYIKILIPIIIGFVIGLQRELNNLYKNQTDLAGARTFAIVALIGYLSTYLNISILYGLIFIIGIGYYLNNLDKKTRGITTEVSLIATYMLGIMVNKNIEFAIYTAVLVVFLLNLKSTITTYEKYISRVDLNAVVTFLLITFIVLPILPNKFIDKWQLINPYELWIFVILLSGLSFLGYILNKILGNKGIYLAGIIGGLASSTATTITFSQKSKIDPSISKHTAIAINLANTLMLLRVFIWTALFNISIMHKLIIPFLLASIAGFIYIYYLMKENLNHYSDTQIEYKNPLELWESLKYGIIFGLIFAGVKVAHTYFGDSGTLIVSFIAGITDVDAITITLSKYAENKTLLESIAIWGILIATFTNQIAKLIYSYFIGSKQNFKYFAIFNLIIILTLGGSYEILQNIK
jgi:uncharacterized membrane protein (DUF4010 family)